MANSTLKNLLTEYDQKRSKAIREADKRKKDLYLKIPQLQKIDDSIVKLAIKNNIELLKNNNPEIINNLRKSINMYKMQKEDIFKNNNINEKYLLPNFECPICDDTGYEILNPSKMCKCLKQKLIDIEYNKSNINNLKNETFEAFNSTFYSENVDKAKYNCNISPKENIKKIENICNKFINNFNDINEKNLLFTGNPGLGKTFLSSCIANKLIKNGKTVLYQTAPNMLDAIIDYKFNRNNYNNDVNNICETILNVDLLIIDDLGTENINNTKYTELFNIINSRILGSSKKSIKTIISTNLTPEEIQQKYGDRIISRFIGHYNICRFIGDDIRLKKIKSEN